ncbi:alpha/beta hydrolase [Planctomicrobium sp. SH668]|uniref:alpha/beta hydrolase n=1 Tax=Planctomicrobium sp. SH668 TaxID=3448126 RepID=UPI003F5C0173
MKKIWLIWALVLSMFPSSHDLYAESEIESGLAPPAGFDQPRAEIEHGKLELVDYYSTTIGGVRRAHIYTPPGYSLDKKYPVLYLLHGIGGDEHEWVRHGEPHVILDNLYADQKIVPMIVVLPNGRASKTLTAGDSIPAQEPAFELFEKELLNDLIPFVESKYSVLAGRESRGLAGLSMGGGQSLNFVFSNLETFGALGAFSPAPNTRLNGKLFNEKIDPAKLPSPFYLSCGDQDFLYWVTQSVHEDLTSQQFPHRYQVVEGAEHDFEFWKRSLYEFAPLLFHSDQRPEESEQE